MTRKEIISLNINVESYTNAIHGVTQNAKLRIPSYYCFANAHMIVEAYKDNSFKQLVNQSTCTFSDGMPLVYSFKKIHQIKQDRIAGIDFMLDLIAECEINKLSVFLFGSTDNVLSNLKNEVSKSFPSLKIAGTFSPPFKKFSDEDNVHIIKTINESQANVVFVSLGCPKQETWMAQHYQQIEAPLLGVGAAFEIHAKMIKRAPIWFQKNGIEWLYRLVKEPKRLWKRYLITNSIFVFLLFKKIVFK
jgi:N-acetylglucosaminyldiphosphoundecaprenol N-acetyl-beta-D-mannosaminyltransferase